MKIAVLAQADIYNTLNDVYSYQNIYAFDAIKNINFNQYTEYDYIIIIDFLAYIDFSKLEKFLEHHKPKYCSLESYWGVGSPHICILHNSIFMYFDLEKLHKMIESQPDDQLLCAMFMSILKIKNLNRWLEKSNIYKNYILSKKQILSLNNKVYSSSIPKCVGAYHNSIFVHYTDNSNHFNDWYNEYRSKIKIVYYNNTTYKTALGINFFIINNTHIAIIDKNNYLYWSNKSNIWKKVLSGKKIFCINKYIEQQAPNTFHLLNSDVD